ncbi:uncharacterized protein LOC110452430 isoform X2 [Mizuhopecten yessoensis]|uniref:StAR-related lipid transfer protein 13 n=1 Tax=Mizuhopecten yessoensis TaxID=6573 RepID=A0A210QJS8_MIZYE|nr:uncharacterized protein LOC110452430 isoform X2 [Mizuhopecten yessoensis]OWF48936.1 StAR-related lipid transfer protein 13 [Mizuhopecten yessoensis]
MTYNQRYKEPGYRYKDTSYQIFLELQRRKDIRFPKPLELTAAIAEEIRVPDADRKKQDGDKNTDSEKLKVILGEWNDGLDDSSSLEDDAVPLATYNLEDSVSLLSDASSDAVSLETTEFDQRSPSGKHRRLLSANECQVEVVVHDTTSIENSLVDQNLCEEINVLREEKLLSKCENDISVVNENIRNLKTTESLKNSHSRQYVTETIIGKCGNSSKIETEISSTVVENSTEKSVGLPSQQCTAKVDKDSTVCNDDSKPIDNRISVENPMVNSVRSPVLQNKNTTADLVCSPILQNNNATEDLVCSPVLESNRSTVDHVCSTVPQNNYSTVDLDSSTPVDDPLMNSAVVDHHVKVESVCLPVTKHGDEPKDNRIVTDIKPVAKTVLLDYSKTRPGLIAESVLSPVEEDTSIPELCSPDIIDDSIKHVTENSLFTRWADTTVSSDECDFRKTETQSERKVYDNIHVREVNPSPSHTASLDHDVEEVGRCSTPTFVPSVDRTEQIISLTLNQHRILRRSKTLPNFSPSKKQKKLNNSILVDDQLNSSYKGENYVFRDSYLRGSTSSSPGGLLVTDIDDPTPVFKVKKHTLSTTAVQTSFEDSSNPSSPKHAASLSQSQQISIGTNTTDSLERPKTRAKRLERLQQAEISNTATTELFLDSSKVKVVSKGHVTSASANYITAVPNHVTGLPMKNMISVSPSHVTSVPADQVVDGNITPTNQTNGSSANHVTVKPFNHMTKVSTTNHKPVIPTSHVIVNRAQTQDTTKPVSQFTPKPKLPTMEPLTTISVTSPAMSPVPPKPSNFSENFQPKSQLGYMIHDESPEMQVIVNATSPVLLRRKPSNSRNKQREIARKELEMYANDTEYSQVNNESKFMDKDMSKTWDGVSRKKWKQYYAPIMQSMLQNGTTTDENCNVKFGSQSLQQKTLLDQMHKKYCAYQYKGLDIPCLTSQQPLVLKPSPPPPDRMRSRSWLLKNYAIILPDSAGVSKQDSASSPKTEFTKSCSIPGSPSLPPSRDGTLKRQKSDDHQTYSTDSSRDTTPTAQLSPTTPESDGDLKLQPGKGDAEIEAVQACRWLKEAGFPQYAQMYDDGHFPVNIASVEKEHDFLEKDSQQPLVRRLNTLNKCAIMRVSTPSTKKGGEDSDDEDQCALSDKWKYQYNIRRWSRKDFNSPTSEDQNTLVKSSSSNDSLLTDQNSNSETDNSPVLDTKVHHNKGQTNDDYFGVKTSTPINNNKDSMSTSVTSPSLRRAASERIKGAKNFLKRVESLKNNRKTKRIGNKNGSAVEISEPVIMDSANMQEKIRHLNCKDLSPSSENGPNSPESGLDRDTAIVYSGDVTPTSPEPWSDETTNYKVPNVTAKSPSGSMSLQELSDIESVLQTTSSFSTSSTDSDEPLLGSSPRKHFSVRRNHSENNLTEGNNYELPPSRPGRFPKELSTSYSGHGVKHRAGSCNLDSDKLSSSDSCTPLVRRRGSADPRLAGHRTSYYDNVKEEEDLQSTQKELDLILHRLFQDINGLNKAIYGEDAADVELPPSLQNSLNLNGLDLEDSLQVNSGINSSDFDQDNDVASCTASSPESSDHDIPCEELSHDDSTEQVIYRERRDSGVGSSLTRTPSDRRRYRIRWHSFQKSHRPSYGNENIQLTCLSICQLMVLQKLSLIKLTALIEKYSPNRPGWNWTVPRFMKRHKVPDYKDKVVFGVPMLVTLQRTGQPLPQCILHAMRYLRKTSPDAVGIFRKPGVRSRIQKLKNELEANPEMVSFEDVQDYDVADLLKQYFRDLPECLLTNKLSEIFINIFIYLPADQRVEALQSSVLLLPDENREVLESLLLFLSDISQHASEHQMTASNLAVCLAPSLFMMGGYKIGSQSPSPRRHRKNLGVPDAREMLEQKAAHECLTTMIVECKKLFTLSTSTLSKCRFSYIEQGNPVTMEEYTMRSTEDTPGYQSDVETCIQGLQKESHDKFRGWISSSCSHSVDVSYKKVADGHPLRLWKVQVEVDAPPDVVLDKLKNERQQWDEDLLKWRCIEKLDQQTDVFQYSRNSMPPHPSRDFVVLRSWRTDLPKGACCMVSFSVEHPKAELLGGVRSVELASHFLIEPCSTGKSRITHITRVDLRGRTSEWYKRSFGHITSGMLERIRDSFKQTLEGPDRESTV